MQGHRETLGECQQSPLYEGTGGMFAPYQGAGSQIVSPMKRQDYDTRQASGKMGSVMQNQNSNINKNMETTGDNAEEVSEEESAVWLPSQWYHATYAKKPTKPIKEKNNIKLNQLSKCLLNPYGRPPKDFQGFNEKTFYETEPYQDNVTISPRTYTPKDAMPHIPPKNDIEISEFQKPFAQHMTHASEDETCAFYQNQSMQCTTTRGTENACKFIKEPDEISNSSQESEVLPYSARESEMNASDEKSADNSTHTIEAIEEAEDISTNASESKISHKFIKGRNSMSRMYKKNSAYKELTAGFDDRCATDGCDIGNGVIVNVECSSNHEFNNHCYDDDPCVVTIRHGDSGQDDNPESSVVEMCENDAGCETNIVHYNFKKESVYDLDLSILVIRDTSIADFFDSISLQIFLKVNV